MSTCSTEHDAFRCLQTRSMHPPPFLPRLAALAFSSNLFRSTSLKIQKVAGSEHHGSLTPSGIAGEVRGKKELGARTRDEAYNALIVRKTSAHTQKQMRLTSNGACSCDGQAATAALFRFHYTHKNNLCLIFHAWLTNKNARIVNIVINIFLLPPSARRFINNICSSFLREAG
jgi:hypothetical protein